jgi:hypothetical protein
LPVRSGAPVEHRDARDQEVHGREWAGAHRGRAQSRVGLGKPLVGADDPEAGARLAHAFQLAVGLGVEPGSDEELAKHEEAHRERLVGVLREPPSRGSLARTA